MVTGAFSCLRAPFSASEERGLASLGGAFTDALVVQAGLDFGGVALVVQFKQTVQDLLSDCRPDRVPRALAGVMEPVVQPGSEQVVPPVGSHHGLVDRPVNLPELVSG